MLPIVRILGYGYSDGFFSRLCVDYGKRKMKYVHYVQLIGLYDEFNQFDWLTINQSDYSYLQPKW